MSTPACPNCGSDATGTNAESNNSLSHFCYSCGHKWEVPKLGRFSVGDSVRVKNSLSVWNEQVGTVSEFIVGKCPVRVRFEYHGYTYGDLFHPAYLERT